MTFVNVVDLIKRQAISGVSPRQRSVLERRIAIFLRHGFIGSPGELESSLIQGDPPERMYANGDVRRINDVSGILHGLEEKGFLVLDVGTEKYLLGAQPSNPEL